MSLSAPELKVLSRLLDEALALEGDARSRWLATLQPEYAKFEPVLRKLLLRHGSATTPWPPLLGSFGVSVFTPAPGTRIGPYRLLHEIGGGGMGSVWAAERIDGTLNRKVALKLPRMAWVPGLSERLARERDILAGLEHPNIARLYDAGVDDLGRPFLALELVEGKAIDVYCRDDHLDLRARLHLFLQVARAVAHAHARLIVHRDLKPSNILVTRQKEVRLLDFGIAKLLGTDTSAATQLTALSGQALTPAYASPEQIEGKPITVASDIYSAGVVLFELLTGVTPRSTLQTAAAFTVDIVQNAQAPLASRLASDKATAAKLRGDLDTILAKALKRDAGQRYSSMEAFAADIERYLEGRPVLARPDSPTYRLSRFVGRHRLSVSATIVASIAVLGGTAAALWQAQRAAAQAEQARAVKEYVIDLFKSTRHGGATQLGNDYLPAALLLERGARQIEKRFANQPAIQAELLHAVGSALVDLGSAKFGGDSAREEIQVLDRLQAPSDERARARYLLARALQSQSYIKEAEATVREALGILGDSAPQDQAAIRILRAELLDRLGRGAEADQEIDQALAQLDRSKLWSTPTFAEAIFHKAYRLAITNRFDQAKPLFEQALGTVAAIEGEDSILLTTMRMTYVQRLISLNRDTEARPYYEKALAALRRIGGNNDVDAARWEVAIAWQRYDFGLISFEEAYQAASQGKAILDAQRALLPAALTVRSDLDVALILLENGRIEQGSRLVGNLQENLTAVAEDTTGRDLALFAGGLALRERGEHLAAEAPLAEAYAIRRQRLGSGSPFLVGPAQAVARNFAMQGKFTDASRVLEQLTTADDTSGDVAPSQLRDWAATALAQVRIDQGDMAGAMQLLVPLQHYLSSDDEFMVQTVGFEVGRVECASSRIAQGLRHMQPLLDYTAKSEFWAAPELAFERSIIGLCALKGGDTRRALEMQTLARKAFERQPQVSSYYKRPLKQLQRELRNSVSS